MPFFPPLRNTRSRLKGGNSARRMGNSRRPARRASHSNTGTARHLDWLRELDQALGDGSDSIINANQSPACDIEEIERQPDVLDAIFDSDIPVPWLPISPPPPPPPDSPPSANADRDHRFINSFNDSPPSRSKHDHGFIDPFDESAIWKTFAQYRSMQRMIRELGEEVETHQQAIVMLKDEHAAEMKKVKRECAVELKKTKEECGEIMKAVHDKELATLQLEVENLENENMELRSGIVGMKEKIREDREWGVRKIEGMGYALKEMMFELEDRIGDGKI